jgi:hypothetical protein
MIFMSSVELVIRTGTGDWRNDCFEAGIGSSSLLAGSTLKSIPACNRYGQRKPDHRDAEKRRSLLGTVFPFFQARPDRGLAVLSDPSKYGGKAKYSIELHGTPGDMRTSSQSM